MFMFTVQLSYSSGEARAVAVGPELVARSDDAGETRWYCGEI
jgi:hypothetical protein